MNRHTRQRNIASQDAYHRVAGPGFTGPGVTGPAAAANSSAGSRGYDARHAAHPALKKNLILSAIACVFPNLSWALPEGGQVVAGSATISSPNSSTTLINQTTNQSIINWTRFNIGSEEFVQFIQPSSSSISLNRVIGGDPSSILGSLSANGHVYLVNPNGIYFGHGVQVDVSGLVASVLDIDNNDFMSGNFVFTRDPNSPAGASVINDGVLTARDNGYVVLMGDYAANNGIIQAHMGEVVLASGSQITMDVSGGNLVSVVVDEATVTELAGVDNSGEIYADGGRVIMTARVASDLIGSAVNNDGLIQANSIEEHNGEIYLTAYGGDVTHSGTLSASAEHGSGLGGGGILIYGDQDVTIADGAVIEARGDGSDDIISKTHREKARGGVVRVIAEEHLDFQEGASIDVSGADEYGGFVELSGHGGLALRGDVNLGSGGSVVIDPAVLNIVAGSTIGVSTASTYFVGDVFIENQLNGNNNVTLVADNAINTSGFVSILATTGTGDLAIRIGSVTPGAGTLGGTAFNCGSAGVCFDGASYVFTSGASGSLNLSSLSVTIAGDLTLTAGTTAGNASVGFISAGGNVSVTAGGNINFNSAVLNAGTSLVATAGNDINVNGNFGSTKGLPMAADVSLNAGNNITINDHILLATNSLALNADTDGNLVGDVIINGSSGVNRRVITQGDLTVTGANFQVQGTLGSTFASNQRVDVQANNINVNLSGNMNISGGSFPPTSAVSSGIFDVSTVVKATNDITISANNLTVNGGLAVGSTSFGSNTLDVNASATLEAGQDLTLTLAGNLNISGGIANASGFDSSVSIDARADAVVKAGRDIIINNVGGDLNVQAGNALATRADLFNASCFGGCNLTANANASLAATGNITITNVGADLSINGGIALANGSSLSMTYVGTSANVIANANADMTADAISIDTVGGSLNVGGGVASAYASHSVGTGVTPVLETATANANAGMMATQAITVNSVGSNLSVSAGNATAVATRSCDSGTCVATANANADITALSFTASSVGGNVSVNGGFAVGVAGNSASNASANANANALISVTQDASITALGSISVWGSSASATAVVDLISDVTMNASAAGALNAGQNVTLDAGGSINVFSGFAVAGGTWSGATATPASNIVATADVSGSVTAGNNVSLTTATELNVFGGFAFGTPSTFGTVTGSASADATATVSAGGTATINVLSGDLFVFDGSATPATPGTGSVTKSATAEGVITAGNLNASINGNLNVISSGSLIATGSMDISASSIQNLDTSGTFIAGTSLAVSILGNYDVVGNYSAGTALALTAGGTLDVNIDLGSSGARLNNDVTLGGRVINLNRDIYLDNNTLTLNGSTGTGTINIANSSTRPQAVVSTLGNLSVTGNNLSIRNTLTGISGTTFSSVDVNAASVNVSITGDLDISAGSFVSPGAGSPVSVDASLNATNDLTISANNVNLNAGIVSVTASAGGSAVPVTANAIMGAGGNVSITATGTVSVQAGSASANAPGTLSTAAVAEANARVNAGGNINVSALNISASNGTEVALGSGTVDATAVVEFNVGGTVLNLTANNDITLDTQLGTDASRLDADVTLSAGNNLTINNDIYLTNRSLNLTADNDGNGIGDVIINGKDNESMGVVTQGALNVSGHDFTINGGMASTGSPAVVQLTVAADDGNNANAVDNINVTLTGDMNVNGGTASAFSSEGFGVLTATSLVNVAAGNDINVTAGSLNINGGLADGFIGSGSASLNATANTTVNAGGNVTADLTGNLNISGGTAMASTGFATGGLITATANAELAAGGDIVINAGGSIQTAPGTITDNTGPTVVTALTADAGGIAAQGNMNLTAGTSLTLNGNVDVGGSSLQLNAGTDLVLNTDLGIDPNAAARTLNATIPLVANTFLNAGNSIFLNGNIYASNSGVSMIAGNDIVSDLTQIHAAGLYMEAGGNIDVSTSVLEIGSGTVAGVTGDALVLAAMQASGIPVPALSDPNARFIAGGTLALGDINLQGSDNYLWLSASETSVNSITAPTGGNLLMQYSPSNPTASISFEELPSNTADVNYNNQDHVMPFPITTLVIGSSEHAGNIIIGSLGDVDIGSKNIVAISDGGQIDSLANVITTGIVAGLQQAVFVTPRLENLSVDVGESTILFDEDEDRDKLISWAEDDQGYIDMCSGQ